MGYIMDAKKKSLFTALGSILIGIGVIWGAVGFKVRNIPFLMIIIILGCIFSYLSKKIKL